MKELIIKMGQNKKIVNMRKNIKVKSPISQIDLLLINKISSKNIKSSKTGKMQKLLNNKWEIFLITFLCYTSIHTLRTSYSSIKSYLGTSTGIEMKYVGIVDSLMLIFLGLGHFMHTLKPINRQVRSLWIAVLACSLFYALIPVLMLIPALKNIYIIGFLMAVNGFLQSYTWPTLLVLIRAYFDPNRYSTLLGFWATNANFGNIMGFAIFKIFPVGQGTDKTTIENEQIGMLIAASYAFINSMVILIRVKEIQIIDDRSKLKEKSVIVFVGKIEKKVNRSSYSSINEKIKSSSESKLSNRLILSENFGTKNNPLVSVRMQGETSVVKVLDQKVEVIPGESPLSPLTVFKDINIVLLTVAFSLTKSVIYGIMLWLPVVLKQKDELKQWVVQIPIFYEIAAIFGSIVLGYLFRIAKNKGMLMNPFMAILVVAFFLMKTIDLGLAGMIVVVSVVGFTLGGTFNTLSGLVVIELTKVIPQKFQSSSLSFYSALTMAFGNITTALTQVLIGFVIGKQNEGTLFIVFMGYAFVCLACFILMTIVTFRNQNNNLANIVVAQQDDIQQDQQQKVVRS